MKLLKRIQEKLTEKHGESIAETLIALLISCAGLLMLASMIASGTRVVQKSRAKLKDYYEKNNVVAAEGVNDPENLNTNAGTLTITITGEGVKGQVVENVNYYINDIFKNTSVISYRTETSETGESVGGEGE